MADRVIEKGAPRDTIVVHENEKPDKTHSNTGMIIAVIVLALILLFLLLGRGLFGGGSRTTVPGPSIHAPVTK